MARIQGTAGSAPASRTVKVKAHTRAAPQPQSNPDQRPAGGKPVWVKVIAPTPKPSPTRIARQQEQGYASQGRAVQVQADRATHPAHPNTVQRAHEAEQQYRSQGRAVRRDATAQQYRAAVKEIGPAKHSSGGGGGSLIAAITPNAVIHAVGNVDAGASMPVVSGFAHVIGRGVKDAEEMAVTMPSSVAHLASTAVHHPEKLPGELAAPYKQLAKHPIKSLSEHPLQTILMVAPAGRMPGRVLGKVVRIAGKQTLERPAAELAGTALKEGRTGSRDAFVRWAQSRSDRAHGTPTVTAEQVQRRVDEFYDAGRHHEQAAERRAAHEARKDAKRQGASRAQRRDAGHQAADAARENAREDMQVRFGHEFGANVRLSTGAAERELAGRQRAAAVARVQDAREAAREADQQHAHAFVNARAARERAKSSPTLKSLERQRRDAARDLARLQRAHASVRVEQASAEGAARVSEVSTKLSPRLRDLQAQRRAAQQELAAAQRAHSKATVTIGEAKGRADVLSRNVGGGGKAGGHGIRLAGDAAKVVAGRVDRARAEIRAVDERIAVERRRISGVAPQQQARLSRAMRATEEAPGHVHDARAHVRDLDAQIAAERQRISGVPPAEHQALLTSIHVRGQAHADLAAARADAAAARATHIAVKQGMAHATLVSPVDHGRLFTHQADAANIARRLSTDDMPFTVKQIGEKWAAVPQAATQRLTRHFKVGTGKATGAKLMRVSRGAFTQSVLPLSPKWLTGQIAEAGIRSAVAGAGPFDLMRFNRVVKRMNDLEPGAGDALKMRITGGHFDLTGPARDFANGKSLADEFADSGPLVRKPAAAMTRAGRTAPMRVARRGWASYTHMVLGAINGAIEQSSRKAMAGQAIKNSALIEHHLIGLTDRALSDAADGLKHTEAQVDLGRAVDRMYGKYQKFSPGMREALLHWTPFLPWYLNVATFLFKVLPVDHPVQTALLADVNSLEERWRRKHDLSLLQGNHVPDFLLGSVPHGKGNNFLRVAHYTPWGVGSDVTGALGSLAVPQLMGPIANAAFGVDWKGEPLTVGGSHGRKFSPTEKGIRAIVTALEEQVPGVSQAGAISGLTPRYVDKDNPKAIKSPGQVLRGYLPTTPTKGAQGGAVIPLKGGVKAGPMHIQIVPTHVRAVGGRVRPVQVKVTAIR